MATAEGMTLPTASTPGIPARAQPQTTATASASSPRP